MALQPPLDPPSLHPPSKPPPTPHPPAPQIDNVVVRRVAQLFAAYQHALQPRLLVPVALGLTVWAYNQANAEYPLGTVDMGCMLLGFLSYKGALVLELVQDLAPKVGGTGRRGGRKERAGADCGAEVGRPRQPKSQWRRRHLCAWGGGGDSGG